MASFEWTTEQRQAIETVGQSVLVSAAAGSGKTAVLAARCAYLVCDAPPPFRCDVEHLLVVTFTEAAAAEMKSRIQKALIERNEAFPRDQRLRAQISLIDAAQISTLHAFCLWMVRRWFHQAGVDAAAQLMDEEEARLLRHETLDALFNELYVGEDALAEGFRVLVEDYGLGDDAGIAAFVLRLAQFLESIPDPDEWLSRSRPASEARWTEVLDAWKASVRDEIRRQIDYCTESARYIEEELPEGVFYGQLIDQYRGLLEGWSRALAERQAWDQVCEGVSAITLSSEGAPRLSRDCPEDQRDRRDRARDLYNEIRDKLFNRRLKTRLCRFTVTEMRAGFERVAPYTATLADLAAAFLARYEKAKRGLGVLDFSDLERLAYRLLTSGGEEGGSPIAAELRERFSQVLVDEFQDINPLQARLLALVSRERSPDQPGNLFTVGDIKQSIYRFRLAEPAMFLDREQAFRSARSPGACIDLQANYRSNRTILEGVNAVFRRVMQAECGGIAYDRKAELRSPRPDTAAGEPIELHVLERRVEIEEEEPAADEDRFVDPADPVQWRGVEREAHLIGRRIREMMQAGTLVRSGDEQRRLEYRDIAVLLRSTRHSAAPLAAMLNQMGIPARADVGEQLFSTVECRDVLALLSVMDNLQQDIPLAAVLRSGMLGERIDEDGLAEIRVLHTSGPFHEAVRRYSDHGPDPLIRKRLQHILGLVDRFRGQARVEPLADVLWKIYRDTGYLAYVGGLPNGERRRSNLIAIHERARQFGHFRRQGLRRFLQFIEMLQERDEEVGSPSPMGESEDAVRVMSIHKAKGLEFPVVFAAELGRQFNLGDTRGRFLYDRQAGIGLKAVDRDRLIEYPTVVQQWCARSAEEASLAEELRIWYVAATRAREKLILVGSETLESIDRLAARAAPRSERVSPLQILTARSPLQWFVAAISSMDDAERRCFELVHHDPGAIQSWTLTPPGGTENLILKQAVANLDPLPNGEPLDREPTSARELLDRLDYVYPQLGVSSLPAARAASGIKLPYPDAVRTGEDVPLDDPMAGLAVADARDADQRSEALRRGVATHTALQFLRLDLASERAEVEAELARLVESGILAAEDRGLIDVDAIAWFLATELGERIRTCAEEYRREWMFLSAEPVELFDPAVVGDAEDRVLIRGVVDGVLVTPARLEVVDFKTDRIRAEDVEARAEAYTMQMRLYASAVSQVFRRRVECCHLVFLHARRIVKLEDCLK